MADQTERLQHSSSEERGHASEIAERTTGPLGHTLLDIVIKDAPSESEPQNGGDKARNFEKEVHSWNPTLPMWRRSPKE